MQKLIALCCLLFSIGLFTCDKDTETSDTGGEVTLTFKGLFDKSALKMFNANYPYESNMDLRFQLFQFYISDVSLLKTTNPSGDSTKLIDVELVSFKNIQSDAAAQKGISFTIKNIPPGTYKGIKIGLGVSSDLNAFGPSKYAPPHPLDDNYWSWASGYVFTKIEGNADLDKSGKFATKLTFHVGQNDFYRQKVLWKDIEVKGKTNAPLTLDVDLHRILVAAPGTYLDFRKVTQDHTIDRSIAKFLSDNLEQALTIHNE